MAAEEHLNDPHHQNKIYRRKKNLVYLIVYGMVIVPFTTSAWFCDVTVYFHPLKVDVCPPTGKTYAKTTGWLSSIHPQDRYPPKTTINPQVHT